MKSLNKMMRKFILSFLVATISLASGFAVRAQESARAEIIKVDVGEFPTMHGMLDVYGADGKFITGLDDMNLTVLENGSPLPVTNLTEKEVGRIRSLTTDIAAKFYPEETWL